MSIGAFYKYGDRTDIFDRSLRGTESALAAMKRDIAFSLAESLKPVFDSAGAVVEIPLLDAFGNPVGEVTVNPAGSEEYNNAVFNFVDAESGGLGDYRLMVSARNTWCRWAQFLSRCILLLMAYQILITGWLALWGKLLDHPTIPARLVVTFMPTGVLVIACLLSLIPLLGSHDTITELRKTYASP